MDRTSVWAIVYAVLGAAAGACVMSDAGLVGGTYHPLTGRIKAGAFESSAPSKRKTDPAYDRRATEEVALGGLLGCLAGLLVGLLAGARPNGSEQPASGSRPRESAEPPEQDRRRE
jgi:hypothetical protein